MIKGKINLGALINVEMEVQGKSGKVKGLFIPIKANKLFEGKNGAAYLDLVAFKLKEPQEYSTHLVKQSLSKEEREKMTKEQQNEMPILGNLNVDESFSETNSNAAPGKVFTPESNDLPF